MSNQELQEIREQIIRTNEQLRGKATTEIYDQILTELAVELDQLERQIFNALKRNPDGLTRRELVFVIYGEILHPSDDINNNKHDRKIRMAIAAMQDRLIPIVSSSGQPGYRLDASREHAERMALELESRATKLQDKAKRIRQFYLFNI